jgi:hypothetical protein
MILVDENSLKRSQSQTHSTNMDESKYRWEWGGTS